MVAPSKLFVRPLNTCHCSQVLMHPGIGCFRYFLNNILIYFVSTLKYLSPILITPLVLKYKIMNRELFLQIVKHYLQTVVGGSLATTFAFSFVCCFRNLLGRFRRYTALFVPSILGMQFCWMFPKRVMNLFTTATSQAVLEGLLVQYSNKYTHLILHSTLVQTILFMLNSAIILHYKSKNIYKGFWFIQPHKNNDQKEDTLAKDGSSNDEYDNVKCKRACDHTNVSCRKFLLDGIASHISYGIGLDLLSMSMKGKLAHNTDGFMSQLMGKLKTFRPYLTVFFISYIGIYRLSSCLLRKYYNHLSLDLQNMMSAFLGGLSFVFVKRMNFVSLSLVISIQLLWQQFCSSIRATKSGIKPPLVLLMLKNAPMAHIIFPINVGYLTHNYVLNPRLVNNLGRGLINGLCHGNAQRIRDALINSSIQSLVELAENNSVKTFL